MKTFRRSLLATTVLFGVSVGAPAWAQSTSEQPVDPQQVQEPVVGEDPAAVDETAPAGEVVVTGSRIRRPELEANSPIVVATGEETVEHADITLETYLNTLPQVNPAGTYTSNNPGNGGQANINLRGLGSNRNLVLVNGRRPMVSAADQTVDVNVIPQGLLERVELVTGGAGAIYGADAVAGVTNFVLKDDFQGIDLRATYSNVLRQWDGEEYQISGTIGGNFDDNRGNLAFTVETAGREALLKGQREFSAQATSTTGSFPTGSLRETGSNPISQAAINSVFAAYGTSPQNIPTAGTSKIGFNDDGSLFGTGIFNSPVDVANFRYGVDSAANPNLNYFPDFYTYNFDIINYLVLPLKRTSAFMTGHYEVSPSVEVFTSASWAEYTSATALAPTPVSTTVQNPATQSSTRNATSILVEPGRRATAFVVPVTNPFIPADLATLLASRSGNDPNLAGAGPTEAFTIAKRFLDTGLRQQTFNTNVIQGLVGVRGDITDTWRYEAYISKGRVRQDVDLGGNVNVQRVQALLESPTGGTELCDGGFNPFGIQPLSPDCVEYVAEPASTTTRFDQTVYQGYVAGEVTQLPGGPMSLVLGAERREFEYFYDAGTLAGPIAGFNTGTDDNGTNSFTDFFGELLLPLVKDGFVRSAEVTLSARHSTSDFNDVINEVDGKAVGSWSYGANFSAEANNWLRFRGSYQRSVRAPNFGELFSGGGSFPQYYDPCSVTSNFRQSGGTAARDLCAAPGLFGTRLGPAIDSYVQTPGSQVFLAFSGNPGLKPEKSDTFTIGTVFRRFGFTGALDYYNIQINDTILGPDPNVIIASCYGLLPGTNTNLDASSPYCQGFFRTPDILFISLVPELGGDENGYFQFVNQGKIKTSGIDLQLGYSLPTQFVSPQSRIDFNLLVNYLIDFKVEELPGVTIDYADTVSYFGAGLGTSFPRWRANLNTRFQFNDVIALDTRLRYIDAMKNRASVQYVGEKFTGVNAAVYLDAALEANFQNYTFRLGLNNVFDRDPEQYAPNVQSGTDPSLYDIYGRRAYVSVRLRY